MFSVDELLQALVFRWLRFVDRRPYHRDRSAPRFKRG
jgi:hypothetical protein